MNLHFPPGINNPTTSLLEFNNTPSLPTRSIRNSPFRLLSTTSPLSNICVLKPTTTHSVNSSNAWRARTINSRFFAPETLLLLVYTLVFLCIRVVFGLLPPDFPQRWSRLVVFSEEAEQRSREYPSHLWEAVVAYEDRRFFGHHGVDLVGIARAVLLFPDGGGGSTITQQLVRNIFLKNDRTISRKVVEMLLALILERRLSKQKILSLYLNVIYWGHGIYGVESASDFYFGKHPSFLSLGESAMLAGMIPAPEIRSPFKDLSRGKISQARALKRMVDTGFLDIRTAVSVVNQPLHLLLHRPEQPNKISNSYYFLMEEPGEYGKQGVWNYGVKEITGDKSASGKYTWDWQRESKIWEVKEDMERWARRTRKSFPLHFVSLKLNQNASTG
ncbi:hypothetical protein Sjap_021494 [Stephania japonica]|uniref:Glycosyl transferase family 51 domain-containing protein n=1 Tax=Stephania japonica TaxID=461633 RepID=A0AAP0HSW8_9MAGN